MSGSRLLIDFEDLTTTVRVRIGVVSGVAVVEDGEPIRAPVVLEIRIVLVREPGVWCGRVDLEVPILPETPNHIALALAIAVVDLYHPVLMAGGVKNIAVRGVLQGVSVKPVVCGRCKEELRTAATARRA